MRVLLSLACEVCSRRNYTSRKNKQTTPDKIHLKKYCRACRKHTNHKETKV